MSNSKWIYEKWIVKDIVKDLNKDIPERCIKCDTKNKQKYYPMCSYCFSKWDKVPYINGVRQEGFNLGKCMIMDDSDDEE